MELAKDLMDNSGMTIVGTLRSNKQYLPAEIVDVENRLRQSSAFLYYGNIPLVSYVPDKKEKKNVLFLSSMHHQPILEENGKPEIVMYYSSKKMRGRLLVSDVCPLFLQQENKKVAFVRVLRNVEHCCNEFLRDLLQQHEKKWCEHYFEKELLGGTRTLTYTTLGRRKSCSLRNEEECEGRCEFGL